MSSATGQRCAHAKSDGGHLLLTRKEGETIVLNDESTVAVEKNRGSHVRISACAPRDVRVNRQEVQDPMRSQQHGTVVSHSLSHPRQVAYPGTGNSTASTGSCIPRPPVRAP